MNYFIHYMGGLKKNILLKIFIFIQIVIVACSINLTIGIFEYTRQSEKIPDDRLKRDGIVIVPADGVTNPSVCDDINSIYASIHGEIEKLADIDVIGKISQSGFCNKELNKSIQVYSYSQFLLQENTFDLKKGSKEDIGYHDKVNHVFATKGSGLEMGKNYEFSIDDKNNISRQFRFKITGIFADNAKQLYLYNKGTEMAIASLYEKMDESCIVGAELKDTSGKVIEFNPGAGVIVKTKPGVLYNDVKESWKKSIGSYAKCISIQELIQKQRSLDLEKSRVQFGIGIVLMFMCITGLGCSSNIKILNEIREYGIYFLCGQKWRNCIIVNAISNLVEIILPFTFGIALAKLFSTGPGSRTFIGLNSILVSFAVIIAVFLITGSWSVIYLAKASPISFLRRSKQ